MNAEEYYDLTKNEFRSDEEKNLVWTLNLLSGRAIDENNGRIILQQEYDRLMDQFADLARDYMDLYLDEDTFNFQLKINDLEDALEVLRLERDEAINKNAVLVAENSDLKDKLGDKLETYDNVPQLLLESVGNGTNGVTGEPKVETPKLDTQ